MLPSLESIGDLAAREVLGTLEQRYKSSDFSRDLWRRLGEAGLLGITVAEELGGSGGSPRYLGQALRRFAHDGCDMGLTLSWITHLALCVKSIEIFGTDEQREKYLPGLLSGELVGAAAISEARAGAHPAGIETRADADGDGFVLNGSKLYTTDGTVADLLIVVASTGESEGGRKELTSFILETSSPGFEAAKMDLNFVKTAPHAQLVFKDVHLGRESMLGAVGEGHSRASRSAFARERAMVTSAGAGLFSAAGEACGERLVARKGGFELEGKEATSWIHHIAAIEAYSHLSADLLHTAFDDFDSWKSEMDLLIYLGISYASWGVWLGDFVVKHQLEPTFPLDIMLNDMKLILIGERVLFKEGRKRYIRPFEE
jgi:alkylation response protein AidB-like acyl-CoA dehydrogenase